MDDVVHCTAFLCILQLGAHADIFVNDAFGTAHRAHASTVGVTEHMEHCVAGLLMEKELTYLKSAVENPKRPFLAVIGGAKVSTKVSKIGSKYISRQNQNDDAAANSWRYNNVFHCFMTDAYSRILAG